MDITLSNTLKGLFDVGNQFFIHREHHYMIVFFKYSIVVYRNNFLIANQGAHHNACRKINRVNTATNDGTLTININVQ